MDYKTVHRDQVIAYKTKLENKLVTSDREQRSASTIVHSLINLKKFFQWLDSKASVKLSCSGLGDYLSPSRELSALASVPTKRNPIPTLKQMRFFITAMPDSSFIERRNQAIIALLMVSGLRIDALLSLQIQHIDIENRSIFQDARIVKTKNKKTMWTKWFPVDDNCEAIVINWVNEVIEKGAKPTDPLFPRALDPIRCMYEPDYMAPLMDQGTVRSIIKQHCALVG